jgi:hypothetical protein
MAYYRDSFSLPLPEIKGRWRGQTLSYILINNRLSPVSAKPDVTWEVTVQQQKYVNEHDLGINILSMLLWGKSSNCMVRVLSEYHNV